MPLARNVAAAVPEPKLGLLAGLEAGLELGGGEQHLALPIDGQRPRGFEDGGRDSYGLGGGKGE